MPGAAPVVSIELTHGRNTSPTPSVTGFYSVAVTTPDLPTQLSTYSEFMLTLPIHPQTHPPGLVVLHWLVWQGFAAVPELANSVALPLRTLQCENAALMTLDNAQLASAISGMIIPVIGGFTVWPLYALGRRLIGTRQAALAAAIFPVQHKRAVFEVLVLRMHMPVRELFVRWLAQVGDCYIEGEFFTCQRVIEIEAHDIAAHIRNRCAEHVAIGRQQFGHREADLHVHAVGSHGQETRIRLAGRPPAVVVQVAADGRERVHHGRTRLLGRDVAPHGHGRLSAERAHRTDVFHRASPWRAGGGARRPGGGPRLTERVLRALIHAPGAGGTQGSPSRTCACRRARPLPRFGP